MNVRGLGDPPKQGKVKEIISKVCPEIVMLQETKLESFEDLYLREVWETRHKDYVFLPSSRASGGMVLIWDTIVAKKVDALSGSFSFSVLSIIWQG